jgi:N-acetyl-gamma-glutamyl-phosphate reductase
MKRGRLADLYQFEIDTAVPRYDHEHMALELQKTAVYGLTELNRDAVKNGTLIANPGCYPTCSQLPLYPLMKAGMILPDDILIDAKSGTIQGQQCY